MRKFANHQTFIVLLIIILGFLLRVYRLDSAPAGALIDELHFGYLAKSLILTGKDEHGVSYPIVFRGFGDQKLPAYAYLLIPVIALLDLSIVAIRIPSLIAGTLLIPIMFWVSKELRLSLTSQILVALLVAVSPWTFFLSRFGFESNIALIFLAIALGFMFKSINKTTNISLAASGIFLGLTWYAYIPYRPISLLLGITLVSIIFVRYRQLKLSLIPIFSMLIIILPLFAPQAISVNSARFSQVGIFSDEGTTLAINEKRTFCDFQAPRVICDLAFNKPIMVARALMQRYLHVFGPEYLSTIGEHDTTFLTVMNYGQFYPVAYVLLFFGGMSLLLHHSKIEKKYLYLLLVVGLLITPIPTILAGEPQKVRLSAFLPFAILVMGIGWDYIEQQLQSTHLKKVSLIIFCLIYLGFSSLYFIEYFTVHVVKNEASYQSYLPKLFEFLETAEPSTKIYIKPFFSDPLMFYAFYTNMHPQTYQNLAQLGELEASGFQHTTKLGAITVENASLTAIGCEGRFHNTSAWLVTDEELEAPILYEGVSSNGVDTYVWVYDAVGATDASTCQ